MRKDHEPTLEEYADVAIEAARALISMVRGPECSCRSTHGELELGIELTGGITETWLITIERVTSIH